MAAWILWPFLICSIRVVNGLDMMSCSAAGSHSGLVHGSPCGETANAQWHLHSRAVRGAASAPLCKAACWSRGPPVTCMLDCSCSLWVVQCSVSERWVSALGGVNGGLSWLKHSLGYSFMCLGHGSPQFWAATRALSNGAARATSSEVRVPVQRTCAYAVSGRQCQALFVLQQLRSAGQRFYGQVP